MLDSLEIREHARSDGSVTLSLRGALDLGTAPLLAARLMRVAEQRRATTLDLHELAFIDASGLRGLLDAAARASREGRALSITRPSESARRLFGLTDAWRFLPLDDDPGPLVSRARAAR